MLYENIFSINNIFDKLSEEDIDNMRIFNEMHNLHILQMDFNDLIKLFYDENSIEIADKYCYYYACYLFDLDISLFFEFIDIYFDLTKQQINIWYINLNILRLCYLYSKKTDRELNEQFKTIESLFLDLENNIQDIEKSLILFLKITTYYSDLTFLQKSLSTTNEIMTMYKVNTSEVLNKTDNLIAAIRLYRLVNNQDKYTEDEAIDEYECLLNEFSTYHNIADITYEYANYLFQHNYFEDALILYESVLPITLHNLNYEQINNVYQNMIYLYSADKNEEKSLFYIKSGINFCLNNIPEHYSREATTNILEQYQEILWDFIDESVENDHYYNFDLYSTIYLELVIEFYGEEDPEYLVALLLLMNSYIRFSNSKKYEELYFQLEKLVLLRYGKGSIVSDVILYYKALIISDYEDYQKAAYTMGLSGVALQKLCEEAVETDLFVDLLIDNQEKMMEFCKDLFMRDCMIYIMAIDEEYFNMEFIFRIVLDNQWKHDLLDFIGFPHDMAFLLEMPGKHITKEKLSIQNISNYIFKYNKVKSKIEGVKLDNLPENQKEQAFKDVLQYLALFKDVISWTSEDTILYTYFEQQFRSTIYIVITYTLLNGYPKYTLLFLDQLEQSVDRTTALVEKTYRVHAQLLLGNIEEANELLEKSAITYLRLIMQSYFLKNETTQIAFIESINIASNYILYLYTKLRLSHQAYIYIINNKHISLDGIRLIKKVDSLNLSNDYIKDIKDVNYELDRIKDIYAQDLNTVYEYLLYDDIAILQNKLPENLVLLEFCQSYNGYTFEYLVFLVHKSGVSHLYLNDSEELSRYINLYRNHIIANRYSLKENAGLTKTAVYKKLYKLVIEPIFSVLPPTITELMIAPDGIFCIVPFELFPSFNKEHQFISEEYTIQYINSGKTLLKTVTEESSIELETSIVIGSPDFSTDTISEEAIEKPLPASKVECEIVSTYLKTKPMVGKEATVSAIINQLPAKVIHVSTHSFASITKSNSNATLESKMKENIMANVGLVFSNGEKLSAQEISMIDFEDTELVVLSACSDQILDLLSNESISGIRKAFMSAGVKNMIINLWNADDLSSYLLMRKFYENYTQNNMSIDKALTIAKEYLKSLSGKELQAELIQIKEVIKDTELIEYLASTWVNEDEYPYSNPYYWAGYISIVNEID